MFCIGPYSVARAAVLAPMAGVSDLPFRSLCLKHGAGLAVSEMVTSDTRLWHSNKSRSRLSWDNTAEPRVVQIAGSDPTRMAQAAQAARNQGAQVVDINMGCPAKKVCNRAAGSALLEDEPLVARILEAVVKAVPVPVTLKIRTGADPNRRNGVRIAKLAQESGIQALTVHGRTRACRFNGEAEYDTIAAITQAVSIPVIANGDITTAEQARQVLDKTQAAAVMIGRGAQGNPWLFAQVNYFLARGEALPRPHMAEIRATLLDHLRAISAFYGEETGVRIARKHLGWYLEKQFGHLKGETTQHLRREFNTLTTLEQQIATTCIFFERLHQLEDLAA